MQIPVDEIHALFQSYSKAAITHIEKIPQAGSERHYFRLHTSEGNFIATYGANVQENETFIYFSNHFSDKKLNTANILAISPDKVMYLQEDFGNTSLLNCLEQKGFHAEVYDLYKRSLEQLATLQIKGHAGLDYSKCLTNASFGREAIMADLLYFKYYFLDALRKPYDKQKLIKDFEALSHYLAHTEYKFFMFRDFQSRNIIVDEQQQVHFIDYQGGMKGAPQYDVASLLWQARANLKDEWKHELLEDYMNAFEHIINRPIDKEVFRSQYNGYVLIRLLQVLGAYGFRGLFERKAHFLTSIPLALQNLKWFVNNQSLGIAVNDFKRILEMCFSDEVIQQFTPIQATEDTPLVIRISSFSYIHSGYPVDDSGNGGGFVFDMRGILNPGRFDEYKHLSGLDKPVRDFLEQQTKMQDFLNGIYSIIDITVADYIERSFAHLSINLGCTGGQHRSVYAAEAIARHLRNKFKVNIELTHLNKTRWRTEPVVTEANGNV